jgi:hypothetical protein
VIVGGTFILPRSCFLSSPSFGQSTRKASLAVRNWWLGIAE